MVRARTATNTEAQKVKVNGEVPRKVAKGRGRKRTLTSKAPPEVKKVKGKQWC